MPGSELFALQSTATLDFAWNAYGKSFAVVGVAEVFDKTWFVTLVLALKYGKQVAFVSSFVALALHTLLAAALGLEISRLVRTSTLQFICAALFAVFSLLYAKDYYFADPEADIMASGKEEVDGCLQEEEEGLLSKKKGTSGSYDGSADAHSPEDSQGSAGGLLVGSSSLSWGNVTTQRLVAGFMVVFIAEWGDRTQFAMVGLNASLPVLPVFLGSLSAFAALTFSAVMVAMMLENQRIRERLVFGIVSLSFAFFACLSLADGITGRAAGQ